MSGSEFDSGFDDPVAVEPGDPHADILIVCEHASNAVPAGLDLGLPDHLLEDHIAWDPGALGVARGLAKRLEAPLVWGTVSRLVYDCNRPPEAPSAIVEHSDVHDIPGNIGLGQAQRDARIDNVYRPFVERLGQVLKAHRGSLRLLVTVHSFTRIYQGQPRDVEVGLLHGQNADFAQRMLALKPEAFAFDTRLNAPYGPEDGVAHTLDLHGNANGLDNVMLEFRSDLIPDPAAQDAMAERLAPWLRRTLEAQSRKGAA